jgi:hypothetical protein
MAEEITADAARLRLPTQAHDGVGRNRRINRVAPSLEDLYPSLRRQRLTGGDDAVFRCDSRSTDDDAHRLIVHISGIPLRLRQQSRCDRVHDSQEQRSNGGRTDGGAERAGFGSAAPRSGVARAEANETRTAALPLGGSCLVRRGLCDACIAAAPPNLSLRVSASVSLC